MFKERPLPCVLYLAPSTKRTRPRSLPLSLYGLRARLVNGLAKVFVDGSGQVVTCSYERGTIIEFEQVEDF